MLSESARMSSAQEARYRVQAVPSTSRALGVVALDPSSDAVVSRLTTRAWSSVVFFPTQALEGSDPGTPTVPVPPENAGLAELASVDVVVMIATSGGDASRAALIGEVCSRRRVPTTTLVLHASPATDEALSKTLAQVRPWSLMVVVVTEESYIESILGSFR